MMTVEGIITVIKAWRSKKIIQFRMIGDARWRDCIGDPAWNFEEFEYREQPEKEVMYISVYGNDQVIFRDDSSEKAEKFANSRRTECIRVEYEAGQFDL